jgi:hypothetical protein
MYRKSLSAFIVYSVPTGASAPSRRKGFYFAPPHGILSMKSGLYGGPSMSEQERRELKNALASTRMEGFPVTEQTERDCVRLLSGEICTADLVKEILNRPKKAV